ncbi:MAG: response regulator [Candidatus Riflebacteria bacterium]|nr:response regulator [Candidatus Riflebacteria bacterium]
MGTILLVDNHPGFRQSVGRYLTLGGFSVVEADSGPAALLTLDSRTDIYLVITDLNMPEMTGFDLIRRVRADPRWQATPIVVLSVSGSPEIREQALAIGASAFMQKPFQLPEFLEAIRPLLKAQNGG